MSATDPRDRVRPALAACLERDDAHRALVEVVAAAQELVEMLHQAGRSQQARRMERRVLRALEGTGLPESGTVYR